VTGAFDTILIVVLALSDILLVVYGLAIFKMFAGRNWARRSGGRIRRRR
jgi:hypothetical protein